MTDLQTKNANIAADIEEIDRNTWKRLLQVGAESDDELEARLCAAEKMLLKAMSPKFSFRLLPKSELDIEGFSIRKHLEDCERIAVMGATLGSGIDRLIITSEIKNVSEAFLLDTGASALIEQVTDLGEQKMMEALRREEGAIYTTGRFSPGYGDYPVEKQRNILALIDGQRRLGITVSEGGIMLPRKSITAVSGLSDKPVSGRLATCEECLLKSKCTLLAKNTHCYDREEKR